MQCNDETLDTAVTNGTWVRFPQSDNDVAAAVTEDTPNTLKDVVCDDKPEDLVLDEAKLHKPGVKLFCSNQDQDHFILTKSQAIIKKDNICVLLCNFRQVLTIAPKLQPDGSSIWWVHRASFGGVGVEAVGKGEAMETNIYCW